MKPSRIFWKIMQLIGCAYMAYGLIKLYIVGKDLVDFYIRFFSIFGIITLIGLSIIFIIDGKKDINNRR